MSARRENFQSDWDFSKRTKFEHRKPFRKSDNFKVREPAYVKTYVCPKCNNFYDFQLLSNKTYVGRVPLLLSCNHTICEVCILSSVLKQKLQCAECNVIIPVDTEIGKRKIQDVFPINFYVFGLVMYYRRSEVGMPDLTLRSISAESKKEDQMGESGTGVICSKISCTKNATLKCWDCDEIFCNNCAISVHDLISVKHDFTTLNKITLELQQKCQTHRASVLEFACKQCNITLCCYCVLSNHKDHEYYQLTEMKQEDVLKITDLVLRAETTLRYLRRTDKKLSEYLRQNEDTSRPMLSGTISKHFEHFHAKLQAIERRLREDLTEYAQLKRKTLVSLRQKVNQNVAFISMFCKYAKQLLNKEDVKYNVKYIIDNLTSALKAKCHLLQEDVDDNFRFEFGNTLEDIDDSYFIKYNSAAEFRLVNAEDVPEDYKHFESHTLDTSTITSNNTSFTNVDENNGNGEPSKNIEAWLRAFSINQTSSAKSEESISSDHCSDKKSIKSTPDRKSVNSNALFSWADECSALVQKINEGSKSPSAVSYNTPTLESGNKYRVKVTHINSPSSFYVHLTKSENVSAELAKSIAEYAIGSCMKVEPEINGIYLVKFSDGVSTQWYRGRIVNFDPITKKYTVFFIDYGNTSVVTKNWIRKIPANLRNIPPLAVECKIDDLWPDGTSWHKEALSIMADLVNKESLLMVVLSTTLSMCNVDLITLDGSTSVRDALIFSGVGSPSSNTNNSLVVEAKREMASFTTKKEIHKFSKKFTEKETVNVVITYAENPFEIYLILATSLKVLNDMKSSMQKFYKGLKKGLVYSLEIGMAVAVNYALFGTLNWFRGTIIEVPETRGLVKVKLVDLGPTVDVPWESLRKLNDKFYTSESLSFSAKMADVEPCNKQNYWPEMTKEFFKPYIISTTTLNALITNHQDPPTVVLTENMEGYKMCLNALLVSKDFGIAVGQYATNLKWHLKNDLNYTVEMMKTIQSIDSIHNESHDDHNNRIKAEVEIVSAETPSLIYVTFLHVKKQYKEVHRHMQDCYSKCEFTPQKWQAKQPVIIRYNNEYLRGIIREEISANLYKVSLKDILKDVEVDSSDITNLHKTFARCPELITRCHLANIIPAGGSDKWPALACEVLQETLKDKVQILLAKCGKIDMSTRSLPILLWYKEFIPGGPLEQSKHILCSVNEILLNIGLALKANVNDFLQKDIVRQESIEKKYWDWLPPSLITDDHIMAIPTCVNDHGHIYIHDVRDKESLEEMSAKLLKHFENSPIDNKLEDWHIGDICIAKYFLNEQWCRAKVVGINETSVSVLMVDYGNEEDLLPCDLRKKILFENIPIFASIVYLQDVNPLNGVWNSDDLDILHGAVVDKEVDVYFVNGLDIHNPSPVYMSYKNISINDFLPTKCKHLENSIKEDQLITNKKEKLILEKTISDYESDGESDVVILDDSKDEVLPLKYKSEEIPGCQDIEIVIINLYEYNMIVFELTNYENVDYDVFNKMQEEIQAEAESIPTLSTPELDAPCIVKYEQNDCYYRGKIIGIHEKTVHVWFVDYGNFEFIPMEQVKEMKARWLDYPLQHHIAEIDGIELIDESKENEVKEYFASFYSTMLLADIVCEDPLKVRLYDSETHKLIYQKFIDDGTLSLRK